MTEPKIDLHQARFKGNVQLDQEAIDAISLDGQAFLVVMVNVEELGATRMTRDGNVVRKDVLNVMEARVMFDKNRDQAVEFLSGKGIDVEASEPEPRVITSGYVAVEEEVVLDDPEFVDPPEIEEPSNVVQLHHVSVQREPEPEGEIGSIYDYKKNAPKPESSGRGDGPRVNKFDPSKFDGMPGGGGGPSNIEQVGSVHDYKDARKDKVLAKFMEGDE